MKTLKMLERERLSKENDRISHILSLYNDRGIDATTRSELGKRFKFSKLIIGNLKETIRIEIAKHINLLFRGINESLIFDEFKNLFDNDIDAYLYRVASLIPDNNKYISKCKSGYNLDIQRAILFFDFTKEELADILSMSRDEAVVFINNKYGTSIPTTQELIDARIKWEESCDGEIRIKNAKELKILGVRNGAFIQTEYPLFFERDVNEYYDKLVQDYNVTLKRK